MEIDHIAADPADAELTPAEIVAELDRYVIAQEEAKRAVAIALRNRWRRLKVAGDMRDEITPKNIIMIGPTGVGKTEISRRLAKLAKAPFVKVDASKFTEVGYVGRDVESIVRDLMESGLALVREEERRKVQERAEQLTEEQLLDLLLPRSAGARTEARPADQESTVFLQDTSGVGHAQQIPGDAPAGSSTREKLRGLLRAGKLEDRQVEVEIGRQPAAQMQIMGPQGFSEIEGQIKDMFSSMLPKQKERKKLKVSEARSALLRDAQDSLIDQDLVTRESRRRVEESGIVFIDEIDKICGKASAHGPDISREGVQRDLLPLVEGSTVSTKYGTVRTDHILFIASGAFHSARPSDLMPEFQGRFPIRVELKSLSPEQFVRILTEPKNALTAQYRELMKTEGVELIFEDEAINELARLTADVNSRTENIGARRLHTLLERLLEDLSFEAEKYRGQAFKIDKAYVQSKLAGIAQDADLARFIL